MLIRKIFDKNDKIFEARGKDSRRKQKSELYLFRVESGEVQNWLILFMFNGYLDQIGFLWGGGAGVKDQSGGSFPARHIPEREG